MGKAIFKFKRTGLQTSIKDMGKMGYQHYGVPIGGAMDKSSAKIANRLVGNDPDTPVFEITLTGPEIEIEGDCQVALTGADMSPSIDGIKIPMYETIFIKNKATLSFGRLKSGCRTYMSVGGAWQVKRRLGSSRFSAYRGLEFTSGGLIQKNSVFSVHTKAFIPKRSHPEATIPQFSNCIEVSILPGPEFKEFSKEAARYFFNQGHYITKDSNRMGYRLATFIPGFKPGREIISSGIIPGTIQITGSGQPIILMADAQTTGGYFRFGNVITPDIDRLAQLKPGDAVRFLLLKS